MSASATSTSPQPRPARLLPLLVALLLWLGPGTRAWGRPTLRVEATVGADLQTITGEIEVLDGEGLRLVDALSSLPIPTDDQLLRLTFPGAPEQGWVYVEARGEGRYLFHSILPRRYDASGMVPGRGLFANGLWHPQPMRGDTAAVVDWEVQLHLPPGHTGVLNRSVGDRSLRWSGAAERLSLAVLPRARVQQLQLPAGRVTLVDQGPRRGRRDRRLQALIAEDWPGPSAPDLIVVETPSRRRLTRPGPGLLFLSDRAFRVSGGLASFHRAPVRAGVLMAGLPIEDPWERSVAAAALADRSQEDIDLREALGLFAWIPQVDELLYDGRLPFYSEVFGETWPGDRVEDDLLEVVDPRSPGAAVSRRIDLRYGEGLSTRLAWAMLQGAELDAAAQALGLPPVEISAWRRAPPDEELSVAVDRADDGQWRVQVHRQASPSVPSEPIAIDVDGHREVWDANPGESHHTLLLDSKPARVVVDPDGLIHQHRRSDDRWPTRWTTVAYLWWSDFSLRGGGLDAGGNLIFRRQYETREAIGLTAAISPQDSLSLAGTWYLYLGPLQDRRSRPFRLWFGGGPALLKPAYRPVDDGRVAVDLYAGGSWDTRTDDLFPRKGHRLSLGISGGQVLASQQRWGAMSTTATGLVSAWGRVALAGRLRLGLAGGDVAHRLLSLGGSGGVSGITPQPRSAASWSSPGPSCAGRCSASPPFPDRCCGSATSNSRVASRRAGWARPCPQPATASARAAAWRPWAGPAAQPSPATCWAPAPPCWASGWRAPYGPKRPPSATQTAPCSSTCA